MREVVSVYDLWRRVTDHLTIFELSERVPGDGFDHCKEYIWSEASIKSRPDICMCSRLSVECYDIVQYLDRLKNEDSMTLIIKYVNFTEITEVVFQT